MTATTFLSGREEAQPPEPPLAASPRLSLRDGFRLLGTPSSEAGVLAYHRALEGEVPDATVLLGELADLRDGRSTRFELLTAIALSPKARARGVAGPGLVLIRAARKAFLLSGAAARVRRRRSLAAQAQASSQAPGAGPVTSAEVTRKLVLLEGAVLRLEARAFAAARAAPDVAPLESRISALETELRTRLAEDASTPPTPVPLQSKGDHTRMDIQSRFVSKAPSSQNVLDLFAGDWTSSMPAGSGLQTEPGGMDLFNDPRIAFANQVLGPIAGLDVLELGPLEGAHTYQLHELGASSITSVEANTRAYLRCLCVKEIFELDRARFKLGSFIGYLSEPRRFDLTVASGVLYHMTEPLKVLDLICRSADRVFLWTHVYDAEEIAGRHDAAIFEPAADVQHDGRTYSLSKRTYPKEALDWSGFTGGIKPFAMWIARESLERFLADAGFDRIQITHDQKDHPNGPSLSLAAMRTTPSVRTS